jgi:selenide,water dikinase
MFGKIAATNAISDIYAMGGTPLMAIAILGWPIDTIDPAVAQQVMEGGRAVCKDAGILLAGGHSIDNPEPVFGLAVTGQINLDQLKRNDTATCGCKLYLTKPLGVGILSTAQKQGKLKPEHSDIAPASMAKLNKIGLQLSKIAGVKAMTDVTGFGLLGHLTEMCEGSNLSAVIEMNKVPVFPEVAEYIALGCIPGGTKRNWESYGDKIKITNGIDKTIICDAQTSGGLLIAVDATGEEEVKKLLSENGIKPTAIGELTTKGDAVITVI